MGFADLFQEPAYAAEKRDLPILRALIDRYARQRPFEGAPVVFGHLYVWNSIALVEALVRGGAHLVLADAHPSPAAIPVRERLEHHGLPVLPVEQAVRAGEWFLDVAAALGRARTPRGAAEVTRTGVLHYATIPCSVLSADDSRSKRIEGFYGTGEGLLRAWRQLRPDDRLEGKRLVLFGYGKIGRGVAPTENRYVDPPLAAHLLALEALLDPASFSPGIHPLPASMDAWVVDRWRRAWPQEDITGIGDELGLATL